MKKKDQATRSKDNKINAPQATWNPHHPMAHLLR